MPSAKRVYVGTHVAAAKTPGQAKREYDRGTAHVCEEDGNPYHAMLDWGLSKDHVVCPDCGQPSHRTKGHWCCPRQQQVVIPVAGVAPKRLEADLEAVRDALAAYCEDCVGEDTPRNRKERVRVERAFGRLSALAKAGASM